MALAYGVEPDDRRAVRVAVRKDVVDEVLVQAAEPGLVSEDVGKWPANELRAGLADAVGECHEHPVDDQVQVDAASGLRFGSEAASSVEMHLDQLRHPLEVHADPFDGSLLRLLGERPVEDRREPESGGEWRPQIVRELPGEEEQLGLSLPERFDLRFQLRDSPGRLFRQVFAPRRQNVTRHATKTTLCRRRRARKGVRVRRLHWLLSVVVLVAAVGIVPPNAVAACHRFEIAVDPATVTEGGEVTITVSRDAAVNPSRVDVSSVDGSARAGEDYPAVERTVEFTAQTAISFAVATTDDSASESGETFKLHLSNPGGCAVNPNFSVGPDAQVTINDNDDTTTTTEASSTTTATSSPPTTAGEDTSSTSSTDTTESSDTTEADDVDDTVAAVEDEDDGGSGSGAAVAFAIIGVLLALGGGAGYALYRRRSAA